MLYIQIYGTLEGDGTIGSTSQANDRNIFDHTCFPHFNLHRAQGLPNDAVTHGNVADGEDGFSTDAKGGAVTGQDAVTDGDAFAAAGVGHGLNDDGVVAAGQVTVRNDNVMASVDVKAIRIWTKYMVFEGDSVEPDIITRVEMNGPTGRVADGDVLNANLLAFGEIDERTDAALFFFLSTKDGWALDRLAANRVHRNSG